MAISTPTSIGTFNDATTSTTLLYVTSSAAPANAKVWLVVQYFQIFGTATTLNSVSDGTLTWRIESQGQNASFNGIGLVSADTLGLGLASGATVTFTFSQTCVDRKVSGFYSTGVAVGNNAYGVVAQNQNANTAWSSTASVVSNGDILVGGGTWEDSVLTSNTASGGNTEIHDLDNSGNSLTSCYQFGTGASIAASGTWTNTSAASGGCRSVAAAYPAATAASTAVGLHPFNPVPFTSNGRI